VPGAAHLSFGHAFVAFIAGDAVGSVTPLGLLASEPTKVFLTRHHLATRESVASLTLENLLYSMSVVARLALGAARLLLTAALPSIVRGVLIAGLAAAVIGLCAVPFVLRMPSRGWSRLLPARLGAVAGVTAQVREFSRTQPSRLVQVFLLDLAYHSVAVIEAFITLQWLMGARAPTLAMAIVFEAVNRINTVLFKFVPFRVGVDEAITGALAPLVSVEPATGVALAVVRKIRNLLWAGVGLAAIAANPARRR
jgi:hypothetical protein